MINRIFVLFLFFLFANGVMAAEHVAVVCPQKFYVTMEPWIKYRNAQGYVIHLFPAMPSPEEIKKLYGHADQNGSFSAMLLVGKEDIPSPQIPCRVVQHFGTEIFLASDDWYADLNEDGLADFPVGRFAVSTVAELEQQIRKTIRYETEIPAGDWSRHLQIVAGLSNFSPLLDGVIESSVRYTLGEMIPESYRLSLLHADWRSAFCPAPVDYQRELIETLNRAPLFWAYLGHGHPKMLDPMETPFGYLPTLCNDNFPPVHCKESLPIALLFCCYGGILDGETPSIGEKLMLEPEGPVAVLAGSRTTMPYGMSVFGMELFQEYLKRQAEPDEKPLTLGALILQAKQKTLQQTLQKPETEKGQKRSLREHLETIAKSFDPFPKQLDDQLSDHVAMFHLFGDPLLHLPVPKLISLNCPTKVKAGSTAKIFGSLGKRTGSVSVEFTLATSRISTVSPHREEFRIDSKTRKSNNKEYLASNKQTILQFDVPLSNGSFSFDLPIPPTAKGEYSVRVFYAEKQDFAIGCAKIAVK